MCRFIEPVLGELQFLRDDARSKNNNCKLKEKTAPHLSCWCLDNFGSSVCVCVCVSSFDNRGETTAETQSKQMNQDTVIL